MTTGNIFTIFINDGLQDHLLSNTDLLLRRLVIIKEKVNERIKYKISDNKLQSNYNSFISEKDNISENLISHGILTELKKTHNCFINYDYRPFILSASQYFMADQKIGQVGFDREITFTINPRGHWLSNGVLHLTIEDLIPDDEQDYVKYCDLIGHRIINNCQVMIGETIISKYNHEVMNKYYQFDVPENKKDGWLRCVGQEKPKLGYMTGHISDEFRHYYYYGDGPQTFKKRHKKLDLWIPLLHWFNKDDSHAFPISKLATGSFKISIRLANFDDLHTVFKTNPNTKGTAKEPIITNCDLYLKHTTTIPEIANILLNDTNNPLIRTYEVIEHSLLAEQDAVRLDKIKNIAEVLYICGRPKKNLSNVDNWHKNVIINDKIIKEPMIISVNNNINLAYNNSVIQQETEVFNEVGLRIKDIDLFPINNVSLYSNYLPFIIEGINTPKDNGWFMFNFANKPNNHNPSGHLNLTKNRELYFHYKSNNINYENRTNLIIVAQIINFLVFGNGSAYLKFT